jgi:hypothetical protein
MELDGRSGVGLLELCETDCATFDDRRRCICMRIAKCRRKSACVRAARRLQFLATDNGINLFVLFISAGRPRASHL